MARILITGGNGLLGTKLLAHFLARGPHQLLSLSRGPCLNASLGQFEYLDCDLAAPGRALEAIMRGAPEVVVHTAAMTDVDLCERQLAECWRANVEVALQVARATAQAGALMVHLSSEYVFDGQAGPYSEDDPPNPISQYGRSKLASEQAVRAECPQSIVARTTVLYGYAPWCRPNFVTWAVDQLRASKPVRVATDQLGSPTLADNLAEMLGALAFSPHRGIFHTVGASVIDRYAFAQVVARAFQLPPDLILPVATSDLRQAAPRPLRAGLRIEKFRQHFPHVPTLDAETGLRVLRAQLA